MTDARRPSLTRLDLLLAGTVTIVIALILAVGLRGNVTSSEARWRTLTASLRCPVCQGLSIADAPAPVAEQMRQIVRDQIANGATDEAIRDYFVSRYGRWILLVPATSGLDVVLWMAPAGLVLLGGSLVVVRARRRPREPDGAPTLREVAIAREHGSGSVSTADPSRARLPSAVLARLSGGLIVLAIAGAIIVPVAVSVAPRTQPQPSVAARVSVADLEARVAGSPTDVDALDALADAYLADNRIDDAIARYRAVLQLDPNNAHVLLQLGVILLAAGRPAAGIGVFDRLLEVDSDNVDALFYRGFAELQAAGEVTSDARRDLGRFLELAPDDPRAGDVRIALGERPSPSGSG